MPLYDYKCATCGRGREVMLKLAELDSAVVHCLKCDGVMNRQVTAAHVVGDYKPYECPVTGKMIEGRRAHIENLKATGCRILEPGESDSYRKGLAQENERFDAMIDETADRLITALPSDKKERLAAEMEAGLTTEIVRA